MTAALSHIHPVSRPFCCVLAVCESKERLPLRRKQTTNPEGCSVLSRVTVVDVCFTSFPDSCRLSPVWVWISGLVWPYSGFFFTLRISLSLWFEIWRLAFRGVSAPRRKPPREILTGNGSDGFSDRRVAKTVPRPLRDLRALGIEQLNIFLSKFLLLLVKIFSIRHCNERRGENRAKEEFFANRVDVLSTYRKKIIFLRTLSVELVILDKLLWFIIEVRSESLFRAEGTRTRRARIRNFHCH